MTVIATWDNDPAQIEPFLACQECGEKLCSVEEGDDFDVLVRVVEEHTCADAKNDAASYAQALCVFRDLLEDENLAEGFGNEYVRGGVNLIADLYGVFEVPVDVRMDDVLADLRRIPAFANPRELERYGVHYNPKGEE